MSDELEHLRRLHESDQRYVSTLIAERDQARVFAEMNANLSAGHCRQMHAAEAERDAAQQDARALASLLHEGFQHVGNDAQRSLNMDQRAWRDYVQDALAAHDARQEGK